MWRGSESLDEHECVSLALDSSTHVAPNLSSEGHLQQMQGSALNSDGRVFITCIRAQCVTGLGASSP